MKRDQSPDSAATDGPRTAPADIGAIDTFVNARMGSYTGGQGERPWWLQRVAEDYFKRADTMFVDYTVEQLCEQMDAAGVDKAILSIQASAPDKEVIAFCTARPDRFKLAVSIDPRSGMKGLRELTALRQNEPVALARVVPFMIGLAPTHNSYYPVFAKCVELNLPISSNAGIPGPPAPGQVQHPMHLDEVCLFFPELVLIMAHGADPWWGEAIRLMLKYKNLYLKTSAWAPRYLPDALLTYMNTRGKHKIIWASDHPVLTMDRCSREARALDLRDGVLQAYLRDNALRLFFDDTNA